MHLLGWVNLDESFMTRTGEILGIASFSGANGACWKIMGPAHGVSIAPPVPPVGPLTTDRFVPCYRSEARTHVAEERLEIVGLRDGRMHRVIRRLSTARDEDQMPVQMSRRGPQRVV